MSAGMSMLTSQPVGVRYAGLLAILMLVCFIMGFEALRDWLDPMSGVHAVAIGIAFVGAALPLLLPLDAHSTAEGRQLEMTQLYGMMSCAVTTLIFVVAPGVLVLAREPVKTRGRCCRSALTMLAGVAGVGALALISPLLAWSRGAEPTAAFAFRLAIEGPLAVLLTLGAITLATHAASGALALPAALAPPSERRLPADAQLTRVRQALDSTRDELRRLTTKCVPIASPFARLSLAEALAASAHLSRDRACRIRAPPLAQPFRGRPSACPRRARAAHGHSRPLSPCWPGTCCRASA